MRQSCSSLTVISFTALSLKSTIFHDLSFHDRWMSGVVAW